MRTELDVSGNISVVKRERGRRVPRGCSGFMVASGEIDDRDSEIWPSRSNAVQAVTASCSMW